MPSFIIIALFVRLLYTIIFHFSVLRIQSCFLLKLALVTDQCYDLRLITSYCFSRFSFCRFSWNYCPSVYTNAQNSTSSGKLNLTGGWYCPPSLQHSPFICHSIEDQRYSSQGFENMSSQRGDVSPTIFLGRNFEQGLTYLLCTRREISLSHIFA